MPFIPVPQAYSLNLHYTLDGQNIHNILNIAPLVPANPFNMPDIVEGVCTWWNTEMRNNFSSALVLQEVTLRSLGTADAPGVVGTTDLPSPGAKTTDSLPNNCAFCVTLRTAVSGRSYRGRVYFSGICDTDAVRSRLDPVVAQEIVNSVNILNTTLNTDYNAMLVVVSRYANGVPRGTGIYTQVISCAAFDTTLDSQRRRLPGRGT